MGRDSGATERSWTWFVAFEAAAHVPVVAVGLVLLSQYRQNTTDETLRDARTRAMNLADLAVGPVVPAISIATASRR